MRKFIYLIGVLIIGLGINSCKCTNDKNAVLDEASSVIDNYISTDRQDMFTTYKDNYRWYETIVLLNNYLDEENDGSFGFVTNVFQAATEEGQPCVIYYEHSAGETNKTVKDGFWMEDYPLNDDTLKVNYGKAFEKIMSVNLPKPHSKNAILREPMGPKACNPQWVFGNIESQIWVDAITGDVATSNPAFDGFDTAEE